MKKLVALAALAAMTSPVWAATQSVTLSVPGMNCATCPITVKKALTKVSGVSKIDVSLDLSTGIQFFPPTGVQKFPLDQQIFA